jgi:hypothetical protein
VGNVVDVLGPELAVGQLLPPVNVGHHFKRRSLAILPGSLGGLIVLVLIVGRLDAVARGLLLWLLGRDEVNFKNAVDGLLSGSCQGRFNSRSTALAEVARH